MNSTIQRKARFLALAAIATLAATSCSTADVPESVSCATCQVAEKVYVQLEGDLLRSVQAESFQDDMQNDLVSFLTYGDPSADLDMTLRLDDEWELTLRMRDTKYLNPWEQVNTPFNVYPTADLEDKQQYLIAELRRGNDSPAYSTHLGQTLPQGISLDVLRITSNNGTEIRARIRDLVLYKNTDSSRKVTINGTFAGAMTF